MSDSSSVLWASLSVNRGVQRPYQEFIRLAGSLGVQLPAIDAGPSSPVHSALGAPLIEAQAFVLNFDDYIQSWKGKGGELLLDEIDKGKRLLVLCYDDRLNPLLDDFGIYITSHKLVTRAGVREFELSEDVLREQAHPLLDGVEKLSVDQPTLIHYTGRAEPLIVLPESSWAVDRDDWRVELGNRRRACAAIWSRSPASSLQIVVIAGSVLTNDLLQKNRPFATNLIRWLAGETWRSDTSNEIAWRHIKAIEVMLYDLICSTLRESLADRWWVHGVPLQIRQEASAREEEEGGRSPRDVYLDLLDLREVIHKNWNLFVRKLDPGREGRDRALKWVETVNRIRRRMAHAVRARAEPATIDEISFLTERRIFMERIGQES